jgi:hypothetical protein
VQVKCIKCCCCNVMLRACFVAGASSCLCMVVTLYQCAAACVLCSWSSLLLPYCDTAPIAPVDCPWLSLGIDGATLARVQVTCIQLLLTYCAAAWVRSSWPRLLLPCCVTAAVAPVDCPRLSLGMDTASHGHEVQVCSCNFCCHAVLLCACSV